MGITGLNQLLRKHSSDIFIETNISDFKDKNIAIDMPIMVMRHLSVQWKKYIENKINVIKDEMDTKKIIRPTITAIKNELKLLRYRYGIGLVLIWEGKASIDKVNNAGKRRKEISEKAKTKLTDELSSVSGDFEPSTEEDIEKYENITKAAKRYLKIPEGFYEELENTLKKDEYCILKANGEAEELCTELCIQGKVEAVYSTDTDCIIRRCPKLITKVRNGRCNMTLYTDDILKKLEITHSQFIDIAILAQCDYNEGIAGIGIGRAYTFIKKYKDLEGFEKSGSYSNNDISKLNYLECRKIFSKKSLDELCNDISPLNNIKITPEVLILPN